MTPDLSLLITLLEVSSGTLMKYAVHYNDSNALPDDIVECWAEGKNRSLLHSGLPENVKNFGPIVAVEEIHGVHHG